MNKSISVVLSVVMACWPTLPLEAGSRRHGCGGGAPCGGCEVAPSSGCTSQCQTTACQPPQYQTVQKTIMVPTWETETVSVPCISYRTEMRQKTETVSKLVPVSRQIQREVSFQVPEQRTKTINFTACQTVMQPQERQYTVAVPYQEMRTATREVCRMIPEQRTRTVQFTTCRTVMEPQEQQYTEMVPYQETRTAVRQVCRIVPEQRTRTVCEDHGSWQMVACNQPCANACQPTFGEPNSPSDAAPPAPQGDSNAAPPPPQAPQAPQPPQGQTTESSRTRWLTGKVSFVGHRRGGNAGNCGSCAPQASCGGCNTVAAAPCAPAMQRVWVPNRVERQVTYTVHRRVFEPQEYQYTVTCLRPEVRTRTVQVARQIQEPQTREIPYTVMVPHTEQVAYQYPVQLCRYETRTQTVQVPQQIQVPQTREVAYTVMVPRSEMRTETVTEMQRVAEQVVRNYPVRVPVTAERQVERRVCKMVPQTIECRVQVAAAPCNLCR